MTFSRQSMFEPAASTSLLMLSITRRTCSAKGGFGKGGTPLLPGLAHRPGKRLVERRQARNEDQVAVAHAQVEGRIRRGQSGVGIVLFHRLLPCAEWYDASGARATPICKAIPDCIGFAPDENGFGAARFSSDRCLRVG